VLVVVGAGEDAVVVGDVVVVVVVPVVVGSVEAVVIVVVVVVELVVDSGVVVVDVDDVPAVVDVTGVFSGTEVELGRVACRTISIIPLITSVISS